jgi:hypothetical protein
MQLLVAMWTQSDEVNQNWFMLKLVYIISLTIWVFITISAYIILENERKYN